MDIALFSATEAELVAPVLPDVETLAAGPCDMLGSNDAPFLRDKFSYISMSMGRDSPRVISYAVG